jgi:hypothetical protein
MIWRLLNKIETTGDPRYILALEAWKPIDYRKLRQRISRATEVLRGEDPGPGSEGDELDRPGPRGGFSGVSRRLNRLDLPDQDEAHHLEFEATGPSTLPACEAPNLSQSDAHFGHW